MIKVQALNTVREIVKGTTRFAIPGSDKTAHQVVDFSFSVTGEKYEGCYVDIYTGGRESNKLIKELQLLKPVGDQYVVSSGKMILQVGETVTIAIRENKEAFVYFDPLPGEVLLFMATETVSHPFVSIAGTLFSEYAAQGIFNEVFRCDQALASYTSTTLSITSTRGTTVRKEGKLEVYVSKYDEPTYEDLVAVIESNLTNRTTARISLPVILPHERIIVKRTGEEVWTVNCNGIVMRSLKKEEV